MATSIELLTSIATVLKKHPILPEPNVIPPMRHPYGKHWEQPDPANFLIDETHVIMAQADFDKLLDYTDSQPTGVYPGKMWKQQIIENRSDPRRIEQSWWLCWFGYSSKGEDFCSTNYRRILIL